MLKKLNLILSLIFIFFSCEKELDINDFSDDFSFYEPELRIEAIIYPSQNTALVRIDKSIRIDEADLFDCIDNDLDWNYYYCEENNQSFESSNQCIENCGGGDSCELHLYACKNFETEDSTSSTLFTFPDKTSCIENCQWSCITDDTGTDGFLTPEEGHGPGFIQPDDDGSENNGMPDCNEPNIDEYDEILPNVHVKDCEIRMTNLGNTCNFLYDDNAGEFFEYNGMKINFDVEVISYGGFIPDSSCSEFNFNNYDTEYELIVDCSENSEFSRYGIITATDIIKKPPVVFHPNKIEDIINCTNSEEVYDCLLLNGFTENDTLIFLSDYIPDFNEPYTNQIITHDDIISTLQNMDLLDTNLLFIGNDEAELYFSALFETSKFQSVQYYWDEMMEKFIYVHGHPDGITDSGENYYDENLCILSEVVVPEQIQGKFRFKYDFYTFSKGFENYYFLVDQLDLSDPIRTNIRDENGNPVMGGFGSMASDRINFIILTPENIIDLILTQN